MQSKDRFQAQLDEFSECILTNKTPEFPVEVGIRNMAAILALYESVQQGTIVKI